MGKKRKCKSSYLMASLVMSGLVVLTSFGDTIVSNASAAYAAEIQSNSLQDAFMDAAKEFNVPESILLSVSYNVSRWESHNGKPSTSGGYGPMHLTDLDVSDDGKGDEYQPIVTLDENYIGNHTVEAAAKLLNVEPDVLKKDPVQNIRGAAALLAQYARDTTGKVPANEQDWYGAVVKYSGSGEEAVAQDFADQVYKSINEGAIHITAEGQKVQLKPKQVQPNYETAKPLKLRRTNQNGADCPRNLSCSFMPAFYEQKSENPGNYSNYDVADRPNFGPDIRYIVIHDTEVSYDGTIKLFANPYSASAQYVIRSSDGEVAQMVDNKDVAWHAGNWYFNMHSIGIEHEGYAMEGASWYSEPMYRASAKLVRYLAKKYDIPLDRAHIIGHEEVPGLSPTRQTAMHSDPGPFWDWEHYVQLLGAPITPKGGKDEIITFKPHFETNEQVISDANPTVQSSNFVYLYQEPSFDAPLFDEPALPGEGSRQGLDWGDKAKAGQTFYLAESKGDWDAIWYGGKKAWFYNPKDRYTVRSKGMVITPKQGKKEIPVYGGAYPEASAYPEGVTPRAVTPLQYTIPEGQFYVAAEKVKSDFYNATVYTKDPYGVHKMVYGEDEYYRIHFNHRYAFVKASDVNVVSQK